MPSYLYKARDETGKLVKGALSAASQEELTDKLAKMGYMTTYVKLVKGIGIERTLEKFKGINTEDMIVFNVQLSNMINAGIPILASLKTLSGQ
ncbi:MAG: type II secretion system F family protein, partial [Candidatus Omnitrophica bacterium]|nr:type II secretion system F family protein [Candidatus Omnitrophota bacterium]